jgi:hypothetical protein
MLRSFALLIFAALGVGAALAQYAPSGNAVPFTATTTDQVVTGLKLPGWVCVQNPQYLVGTTTVNTTPLQVNYTGGNSSTAPQRTLSPGQIDDCMRVGSGGVRVSVPTGTLSILLLQVQ